MAESSRPLLWEFGSNLSPMEKYVLNLHDQMHDMELKIEEIKRHQTWVRRHPYVCDIPTKYTYIRYQLFGFANPLAVDNAFLDHVFLKRDECYLVRFAVWKIVPILDMKDAWEVRCCIQWSHWVDACLLKDSLKTTDTRFYLKTVSAFDSFEMFVAYIEHWVPEMTDGWCRAWLRPSGLHTLEPFSFLDSMQDHLAANWGYEALRVWLWNSVDE